jgi:glyoxylate reductase
MGRVFVSRRVQGGALDTLVAAGHEVDLWPGELPPPPEALVEHLAGADAAMTMVTDRFSSALLATSARLKVIANVAVGYDNVDPAEASAAGIWLTNTPGVLAETTADHTFALLMAAARHVVASDRDTRAGGWKTWSPTAFLGSDVHHATLGIVGLGEIGQAVARRAAGFAMKVLYTGRMPHPDRERALNAEWRTLPELLAQSDFVSLHASLNPESRHLIGAPQLAAMKRSAILVNTSRGQVVDQDALVAALQGGWIGGAALDVTDPEPLPLIHPLYASPNVIITPHIASASFDTRSRMAAMAAANVVAVLEGREPPNPVNRPPRPRA